MVWLALLVAGCAATVPNATETCALAVDLQPASAQVSDSVVAYGGPFLQEGSPGDPARTTTIAVGGVQATVLDVTSTNRLGEDVAEDCALCQECRARARCAACGLCDGRLLPLEDSELRGQVVRGRRTCFGAVPRAEDLTDSKAIADDGACGRCVQQVSFAVPEIAPGSRSVTILGPFGQSPPTPFTVLEPPADTSTTGDTGATDTATSDTSTADTATP